MNITFLIGNGFDLGLGMKSQYSDFIPLYIKGKSGENDKNKYLKDFSSELDENIDKWSSFEKQLGVYTKEFTNENFMTMVDQLADFQDMFVAYLKSEENRIEKTYTKANSYKFYENLTGFYGFLRAESKNVIVERISRESDLKYQFINFNYTNTLEQFAMILEDGEENVKEKSKCNTNIGEIVHVHGTIEDFSISGVNDPGQIMNKELAKNSKFINYIVKHNINIRSRTMNEMRAHEMINSSVIICVYGMSLGESDGLWWKKIAEHLFRYDETHLVLFIHKPGHTYAQTYRAMIIEDDYLDKLQAYCGENNIRRIQHRIHICFDDIFSIVDLEKGDKQI